MAKLETPFSVLPDALRTDIVLGEYKARYEYDAGQSRRALWSYFRYNFLFIVCALLASIASGLLLYGSGPNEDAASAPATEIVEDPSLNTEIEEIEEAEDEGAEAVDDPDPTLLALVERLWVTRILAVLAIIGALGSTFSSYMLSNRDLERRWVLNHVKAEEHRLSGFRVALERGHEAGREVFVATVKSYITGLAMDLRARYMERNEAARQHLSRLALFGALIAGLGAITGVITMFSSASAAAAIALFGILTPAMSASARSWADAAPNPNAEARYENASKAISQAIESHADTLEQDDVTLETALAFADEVETAVTEELAKFRTRVEE